MSAVDIIDVTDHSGEGFQKFVGASRPLPKPHRKIGIRIKRFKEPQIAHPAIGAIEVFDVETGQVIDGISTATVRFDCREAIQVDVTFYASVVEFQE